jgi:hypothetical protein
MSWPSPVDPIEVTINGVTYEGTYYVQRSTVYVQSAFGTKSAPAGGWPPVMIAKKLLSELVRASFSAD